MPDLALSYDRHHLTFHRLARDHRQVIAVCSCGWETSGRTHDVYTAASKHDGKLEIPNASAN